MSVHLVHYRQAIDSLLIESNLQFLGNKAAADLQTTQGLNH